MADRGRDLKVSILSDLDKFDLDPAANDLESLGKEAKSTAEKVDDAFDKIAKSSRSNFRKVDNDVDKAKKGLDDFKGEAHSTGREAAASFSGGFDDVADAIQETAANAFAGFGPIGAAAGLAAAAGIGFIVNKINESKERVRELTQNFVDLRRDGIDPAADAAAHFVENLDAADIITFKEDADKLGLSFQVVKDALDGNAEAIDTVRVAMEKYNREHAVNTPKSGKLVAENFSGLKTKLNETEEAHKASTLAIDDHELAQKRLADQAGSLSKAMQGVSDDAADMAAAIGEGADAVIAAQEKQLEATLNYKANYTKVLDSLGQDAIDWAMAQGDSADEALQLLATAPKKKGEAIVANWRALGQQSTEAAAEGMISRTPAVQRSAYAIHREAAKLLGQEIEIPVVPKAQVVDAARIRRLLSNAIGDVPVNLVPKYGQGRYVP